MVGILVMVGRSRGVCHTLCVGGKGSHCRCVETYDWGSVLATQVHHRAGKHAPPAIPPLPQSPFHTLHSCYPHTHYRTGALSCSRRSRLRGGGRTATTPSVTTTCELRRRPSGASPLATRLVGVGGKGLGCGWCGGHQEGHSCGQCTWCVEGEGESEGVAGVYYPGLLPRTVKHTTCTIEGEGGALAGPRTCTRLGMLKRAIAVKGAGIPPSPASSCTLRTLLHPAFPCLSFPTPLHTCRSADSNVC